MAFLIKNWSSAGANSAKGMAPQKFTYFTDDTHATVDTSGYFNAMAGVLNIGDIIDVVVVDDPDAITSVITYGPHIVLSNAAGVVDVSNVTVGVVTDTD